MVAHAEAARSDATFPERTYREIHGDLRSLPLPIGWNVGLPRWPQPAGGAQINWPEAILGWLITAVAATLGAPFWFDLLNKVMVIRSTVKPHEKSPEESSEDRQLPADRAAQPAGALLPPGADAQSPAASIAAASRAAGPAAPPARVMVTPDAIDGCDVEIADVTADEDLPAAEGGVA